MSMSTPVPPRRRFPLDTLQACQRDAASAAHGGASASSFPLDAAAQAYVERLLPQTPATRLQQDGIRFILSKQGRCLCADEMGVGKTLQGLLSMWHYHARGLISTPAPAITSSTSTSPAGGDSSCSAAAASPTTTTTACSEFPLLVICPSTLRGVWRSEAEKWLSLFPGFSSTQHVQVIRSGKDTYQPGKLIYIISYSMVTPTKKSKTLYDRIPAGVAQRNAEEHRQLFGEGRFLVSSTSSTSRRSLPFLAHHGGGPPPGGSTLLQNSNSSSNHLQQHFKCVIVDESHYIKSADSNRCATVLEICRRADRCILLSGTPAPNHPFELFTQLRAIFPDTPGRIQCSHPPRQDRETGEWHAPGEIQIDGAHCSSSWSMSHTNANFKDYFKHRYCEVENRVVAQNPWNGKDIIMEKVVDRRAGNMPELHKFLQTTCMTRRTKEEALPDLPELRRTKVALDGIPQLRKEAKAAGASVAEKLAENLNALSHEEQEQVKLNFKETGEAKAKGVCEFIGEFLSDTTEFGEKILIFGHHTRLLEKVEEKVKSVLEQHNKKKETTLRLKYAAHYGKQCNPRTIDAKVDAFQKDDLPSESSVLMNNGGGATSSSTSSSFGRSSTSTSSTMVFILGITAGNVGLTLTRSSIVLFAELYWVPAVLLQAEARIHRKGQQRMAEIYYLMHPAPESLDSVIFHILNKKYASSKELLDGASSEGDENYRGWHGRTKISFEGFEDYRVKQEEETGAEDHIGEDHAEEDHVDDGSDARTCDQKAEAFKKVGSARSGSASAKKKRDGPLQQTSMKRKASAAVGGETTTETKTPTKRTKKSEEPSSGSTTKATTASSSSVTKKSSITTSTRGAELHELEMLNPKTPMKRTKKAQELTSAVASKKTVKTEAACSSGAATASSSFWGSLWQEVNQELTVHGKKTSESFPSELPAIPPFPKLS